MPPIDRKWEEKLRRRLLARLRFKALVRRVIFNNYWLSEIEDQKIGDNVHRNVAIIQQKKRTSGMVTILVKTILNTPAELRTDEQKRKIIPLFLELPCMWRFPPIVRAQLASCSYFFYYPKERVILRQGHPPSAMYFIITGEVNVSKRRWDTEEIVGHLFSGDMFGEVALLFDKRRDATISAKTDVELLCIFRKDFNRVLRPTLAKQWQQNEQAIARFDYFDFWSPAQKHEACIVSQIRRYKKDEVIFSEMHGQRNFAHFVLSGHCMVLQILKIKAFTSPAGGQKLKLVKTAEEDAEKETIEHKFIDVGTLSCGAAFGLGEDMVDRSIVARDTVQCLLIPRNWLFLKAQNKGNLWERIRLYLNSTIPSREAIFKEYLDLRKWRKYKKELIQTVVSRKKRTNTTTYFDIPIICRVLGH